MWQFTKALTLQFPGPKRRSKCGVEPDKPLGCPRSGSATISYWVGVLSFSPTPAFSLLCYTKSTSTLELEPCRPQAQFRTACSFGKGSRVKIPSSFSVPLLGCQGSNAASKVYHASLLYSTSSGLLSSFFGLLSCLKMASRINSKKDLSLTMVYSTVGR